MRLSMSASVALSLAALLPLSLSGGPNPNQDDAGVPAYRNPNLTIDERVADLLPRMTIEEKVAQISGGGWAEDASILDTTGTFTPEEGRAALRRMWDHDFHLAPRKVAILRNALQRYLLEKTRLGIPALVQGEALHGFMQNGSTSFPQALALASTWDPALIQRVFSAAADEAASSGTGQVFTPVLDIARDPRWGRTEETYGEDPFLAARIGVAAIRGLQGDTFMIDRHHVLATAKHFAVHGQPEGGTNTAPGNYSERVLRETFLVPFEAAVREADVGSVMASYNEIDGIPAHANRWLLGELLREEWGFRGYVTGDANGLQMLVDTHGVAADKAHAARLGIAAGVDYDLSDGSIYRTLVQQVRDGIVAESDLDATVGRVLAAKLRLGLFDDPYVDPDYAERVTGGTAHRALAVETAERAIILLKNEGNLLPLDLNRIETIAVIGPNAADVHLGGYSREPAHGVSVLQGIRDRVGAKAQVVYAEGCRITNAPAGWRGWYADDVELVDPATQTESIRAAAEAARAASVAILVVGENESTNREAWSERHLGDRDSLALLGAQQDLVNAVLETGTPTVVFLLNGRPLAITDVAERVPAILEGWYLGQEGGTAAARVLFGDVNPGGKLPITFPRTVGALPAFYNRKPSANRTYAFSTREPLFPFGHGLSYTTFSFDNLRVEPQEIHTSGTATVRVDVTNTGAVVGDEVVQLYVHQRVASVTRPVKQLQGFERISLKPGETRTVELRVTPQSLALTNRDMRRVVEPGIFDLMVGPSSAETRSVRLTVTGPYGETGLPPLPPAPAGSEVALVSTFDDGKIEAAYGTWLVSTDQMRGGSSSASMAVVDGGADGTRGALRVQGEVAPGEGFAWAGVAFAPAGALDLPANLSSKKQIAFWLKGDGQQYSVTVLSEANAGGMPPMKNILAGGDWERHVLPISDFGADGHDVLGIGIIRAPQAGTFELFLDQVEIE